MSYDITELITFFRQDMSDETTPYLWSDLEIVRYLAEAQDEFMLRTKYAAETLSLSYTAGAEYVEVPYYISKVRTAYDALNRSLDLMDKQDWENLNQGPAWRARTGAVTTLITDLQSKQYRLYPIPEEDGSLYLDTYRTAKQEVGIAQGLEVTDPPAQRTILLGARAIAYGKQDADVFEPKAEAQLRMQFEIETQNYFYRVQGSRRYSRPVSYGGI